MKNITPIILACLFYCLFSPLSIVGQSIVLQQQDGNYLRFLPDTTGSNLKANPLAKQLNQKPYFTYFWNFGDGNYCTDPNPEHVYKAAGNYTVILELTGIKSDPDDDVVRVVSMNVNATLPPYKNTLYDNSKFSPASTCNPNLKALANPPNIRLGFNRQPIVNQPVTYIISYDVNVVNPLVFQFETAKFDYLQYQTFHGETPNLANINAGTISFVANLAATGTRNIYVTLQPKNIAFGQATSCSLDLTGFSTLLTQANTKNTGKSYDPNTKWVHSETTPNWNDSDDFCVNTVIIEDTAYYRIEFENLGDGPVKNLKIVDYLSSHYSMGTVQVISAQVGGVPVAPVVSLMPALGEVHFTVSNLQNIAPLTPYGGMPGSSMAGLGSLFQKQHTWGFVTFRVRVNTYPAFCQDINNYAAIYFDNNPPELTPNAPLTRNPIAVSCQPLSNCNACNLSTSGNVDIDSGDCTNLSAIPHVFGADTTVLGIGYTWYPGGQTTQGINVCPTQNTIYTVEARYLLLVNTTPYSCIGRQSLAVTVNQCVATPPPISIMALTPVQVCAPGAVYLTASGISAGYTYRWYVDGIRLWEEDGNSSILADISGSYTVVAWCTCPQTSSPIDITVFTTCPCTSGGRTTTGEWINSVSINGTTNTSGNNNGYVSYAAAAVFVTLNRGQLHPITLSPLYSGTSKDEHWSVFIDLNQDFIFQQEEKLFTINGIGTQSGQLFVPFWAQTGTTRMRISMQREASPDACDDIIFGEVEDYYVQINDLPYLTASMLVRLEGPYSNITGAMTNQLRTANLLPIEQPFDTAPWWYEGMESVAKPADIPVNAVDWLLIEALKPDDYTLADRSAVWLLQDGSVRNMLGQDGALFYNLNESQPYVLVVRSRNHLAVASSNEIFLTNAFYNFTLPANVLGGTSQLKQLSPFLAYAMFSGDVNADGVISVADYNSYQTESGQVNQYLPSDMGLNGTVTVQDFNLLRPNISVIGVPQVSLETHGRVSLNIVFFLWIIYTKQ